MGYRISVHTRTANGNGSRELYQNALGTATNLWHYWLRPAGDLGLTFLREHFDDGMEVSGHDLDRLASELDRLEHHWLVARVGASEYVHYTTTHDDGSREEGDIPMHDHLRERLSFLREAIRIARESDGLLTIS